MVDLDWQCLQWDEKSGKTANLRVFEKVMGQ